jgi:hypothetical protein
MVDCTGRMQYSAVQLLQVVDCAGSTQYSAVQLGLVGGPLLAVYAVQCCTAGLATMLGGACAA